MITYRYGNWVHYNVKFPLFRYPLLIIYRALDIINVKIIAGAEIPCQCKIGTDLMLCHGGRGVVISPFVIIGNSVKVFHQVTIGLDYPKNSGVATIGDNVIIGTGAKIIGPVTIGKDAKIGANAVVTKDIPESATAVGIPAKIVSKH